MGNEKIDLFLDAIVAERDAALNTLLAYRRDLEAFGEYLAKNSQSFSDATRQSIEEYLGNLTALGMAPKTRARHLSSIRQFFRFLFVEGHRTDDPSTQISGPRIAASLPSTLSMDEVDALLDQVRQIGKDKKNGVRDAAILELLYATGMRISELVSLPIAATAGNPSMILVRGKGGRERMVPLTQHAQAALADWKTHLGSDEKLKKSQYLFPTRAKSGHVTRQTVFLMLKSLAVKAGLDPSRVSPHVLRHAFATHLLANGADLRAIQMLLGHADVATTEIYTHVLDEHLTELVLNKHPLSNGT